MNRVTLSIALIFCSCSQDNVITPDHVLNADQKHNKFSKLIPPVLTVKSGEVIKADAYEASDNQLHRKATLDDLINIDFGPIHAMTGPVYIEEAEVGDILAVDLLKVELHDYGWQAIVGGFGFLTDRFPNPKLNIHEIDVENKTTMFNDKVKIPLKPFCGTIGLALAILAESTLSFLGVGVPPTTPSLGTLIRLGNDFLFSGEWWITFFPAIFLVILAFSINLLGDWMRDTLNPKLKK